MHTAQTRYGINVYIYIPASLYLSAPVARLLLVQHKIVRPYVPFSSRDKVTGANLSHFGWPLCSLCPPKNQHNRLKTKHRTEHKYCAQTTGRGRLIVPSHSPTKRTKPHAHAFNRFTDVDLRRCSTAQQRNGCPQRDVVTSQPRCNSIECHFS